MPPIKQQQKRTLAELAEILNATLVGDGSVVVSQLVHPRMAQSPEDLALAIEPGAFACLKGTPVQAAVISDGMEVPEGLLKGYLIPKRPRYALASLLEIFDKPIHAHPGIHPTAVIESTAQVDPSVSVGPFVYVGEFAAIAKNSVLMAHVTIGAQARIGEGCLFHPGSRIGERVMVGHRVIVQHNASIGADGFSYVTPEAGSIESARASGGKIEAQNTQIVRINSIGTVILEDDVEVGACATIDRATIGATIVKKGTKIDNLVMIGHNNTIGENCLIVSQVGVSGSCKIGNRVVLAGQSGLKDHIEVGDDAIVMAQSGVMRDIPAKSIMFGSPALPQREGFQIQAYMGKLKQMHKDITMLKGRLAELEAQQNQQPAGVR